MVETRDFFATMQVDSSIPEADPEGRMRIQRKPEETPVTLAAKRSLPGPGLPGLGEVSDRRNRAGGESSAAYIVRFRDLRYDYPDQLRRGVLGASVELDRNLKVVSENFGSRSRKPQAAGGRSRRLPLPRS